MTEKNDNNPSPDENVDTQHADLGDDFGDIGDDQFDDYELDDTEHLSEDEGHLDEHPSETEPSEEEAIVAAEITPSKKGIVDLLKENWLFIVIGLGVVSFAGYMVYGVLEPTSSAPAPTQQSQSSFGLPQQQAAAPQAPTASNNANAAPAATAQPQQMPMGQNIVITQNDFQTLMQGFQQMVQQNSQGIQKSLQTVIDNTNQANTNAAAITAMQAQFTNLNQQISKYNQSMANLDDRLTTLQGQLTLLVAQQTAQSQQLTLRAVVPGRAWLIDGKGNTISVTQGTQLGSFGIVTNIDSASGQVTTSSGYIFK